MIQDRKEELPLFVTKVEHYPIVLGITWLRLRDVVVMFASNTVTSGSQYWTKDCHDAPGMVQGVTVELPELVYPPNGGIFEPQIRPQQPFRGKILMLNWFLFFQTLKKGKLKVFKASRYDINKPLKRRILGNDRWRNMFLNSIMSFYLCSIQF